MTLRCSCQLLNPISNRVIPLIHYFNCTKEREISSSLAFVARDKQTHVFGGDDLKAELLLVVICTFIPILHLLIRICSSFIISKTCQTSLNREMFAYINGNDTYITVLFKLCEIHLVFFCVSGIYSSLLVQSCRLVAVCIPGTIFPTHFSQRADVHTSVCTCWFVLFLLK